jgi:hypothetical protein
MSQVQILSPRPMILFEFFLSWVAGVSASVSAGCQSGCQARRADLPEHNLTDLQVASRLELCVCAHAFEIN